MTTKQKGDPKRFTDKDLKWLTIKPKKEAK